MTTFWRCNLLEYITAPFSIARLRKTPDPDVLQNFWQEKFCQFFPGSAGVQPPRGSLSKHSSLQWPSAHVNSSPLLSVSIGGQLKQALLVPLSQPFDPPLIPSVAVVEGPRQDQITSLGGYTTSPTSNALAHWAFSNMGCGWANWKCGRVNWP